VKASDPYVLSILIEDTGDTMSWSSLTPFQAISRGDFFDTTGSKEFGDLRGKPLRVVKVEHVVWEGGDKAYHQVRLTTRLATRDESGDVIEEYKG
jgi:hypothetical protein